MPRPNMRGQFLHLQEPFDRELTELFRMAYGTPLALLELPSHDLGNILGISDHSLFVSQTITSAADTTAPDYKDIDNRKMLALNHTVTGETQLFGGGACTFLFGTDLNSLGGTFTLPWHANDPAPGTNLLRAPFNGRFTALHLDSVVGGSVVKATSKIALVVNGSDAKTLLFGAGNIRISWQGSVPISKLQTFTIRFDMAGADFLHKPNVILAFEQTSR